MKTLWGENQSLSCQLIKMSLTAETEKSQMNQAAACVEMKITLKFESLISNTLQCQQN